MRAWVLLHDLPEDDNNIFVTLDWCDLLRAILASQVAQSESFIKKLRLLNSGCEARTELILALTVFNSQYIRTLAAQRIKVRTDNLE